MAIVRETGHNDQAQQSLYMGKGMYVTYRRTLRASLYKQNAAAAADVVKVTHSCCSHP